MQNAKKILQPHSLVNLDTKQEWSAKHFRALVLQDTHQRQSMRAVPLQKGSPKPCTGICASPNCIKGFALTKLCYWLFQRVLSMCK